MITELTQRDVYHKAPSVFAEAPAATTSDRYSFLSTKDVLSNLSSNGYGVVEARQTGVGRHAKHMITLTHRDHLQSFKVNEVSPRIQLINSHDGTCAYKLMAGLFRLVCSNGMTVSEGFVPAVRVRHSGHELEEVVVAADTLRGNTDKILSRVEDFKARLLTQVEQFQLAKVAAELRYGKDYPLPVADRLLLPRRYEDKGHDLWHVFNRVQENLVRGGFRVPQDNYGYRNRRAKEITAIDTLNRINTQLWEAAEGLALPS